MRKTKKHKRGKFIVFEGLDGAGTESISRHIYNYFKKKNKQVVRICYPDYKGPIGRLIHRYLHRQYDFSVYAQFLLYLIDFVKDKDKIEQWLKEGKNVISDRYFTSTLAYQGLRGFPQKEALNLAKVFDLPRPDLVLYLRVSPSTSIKRKLKEKKSLDRNEKDKKLLAQLTYFYDKLAKKQIFSRWRTIDGEGSIKEVSDNCLKIINKELKLNL